MNFQIIERKPTRKASKTAKTAPGRKKLRKMSLVLKDADAAFSGFIRARDGKCLHPIGCNATKDLQCSHYIGRAHKATRFDPDNCITLCWFHHYKSKDLGFEYQKQRKDNPKHKFDGQYTIFMEKWLGPKRWKALLEREKQSFKLTREYLTDLIAKLSI